MGFGGQWDHGTALQEGQEWRTVVKAKSPRRRWAGKVASIARLLAHRQDHRTGREV